MNRDRILRADVDKAFVCADSVACDSHCLKNCVGVALKNGAVHECARVALIGVAAYVLFAGAAHGKFPLETRGEAGAAASAEAGIEQSLNNVLAAHLRQHLCQRKVAVHGDILVYLLGVDNAAVAKRNSLLLLVERGLVKGCGNGFFFTVSVAGFIVNKTFNDTTLEEVLGNDFVNIFGSYS